jgi:hypothetical protein
VAVQEVVQQDPQVVLAEVELEATINLVHKAEFLELITLVAVAVA